MMNSGGSHRELRENIQAFARGNEQNGRKRQFRGVFPNYFSVIRFYLQSVPVHSGDCVKLYSAM
jgi:hypothetical protein